MTINTPFKNKKRLAYFLACSDNIIFAAGNVALSLNKYMPKGGFDIVIYHTGLRSKNEAALKKIPNVVLHHFTWPEGFKDEILARMPIGRWNNPNSLLAFAHYEIFDLLHEYETAIWIDVDTSIQADISGLEKYVPYGQCYDENWNTIWTVADQFVNPPQNTKYNLKAKAYINACIVVSDKLPNWEKLTAYCYEKSLEYAEYLKNCDQAVFSMMIQDFNIKVNVMPWHDYICHAHHEHGNLAKIVHFGCHDKVWTDDRYLRTYPEWFRTHMQWLELGGEDFDRTNMSMRGIWAEIYGNQSHSTETVPRHWKAEEYSRSKVDRMRLMLFGIPLFSRTRTHDGYALKLLGLPLCRISNRDDRFIIYTLGKLEIYKRKDVDEKQRSSYYLFGIPFATAHKYILNRREDES